MQQGKQGAFEALPIARNCQAQGQAAGRFGTGPTGQREPVQLLRAGGIADEVEGQPAILGHPRIGDTRLLGLGEQAQGLDRTARAGVGLGQPHLAARIARRQLVGAAEKADCRVDVTQFQRRFTRIEQCRDIERIARQPRQRVTQPALAFGG